MYQIVEDRIRPEDLLEVVSGEEMGAIATFFGTVRCTDAGRAVVAIEYQAYTAMAERVMREIGEEVRRGFGAVRVAMVHRVGRLAVGETSVGIVVGAPHRHQALGAVAYAIERLKQVTPIWKKEFYSDGSDWLEPPAGTERA